MKRLILATRNANKVTELRAILEAAGLDVELVGADAYPGIPDVKETGVTFAENALLKAHALARATGFPAVADDSGLCVDVLNGAPGIFSARWAGRHGDDKANLELLLAQLGDIADEHRGAHFNCAAALALPDGTERVVEGRLRGTLRHAPVDQDQAVARLDQPHGQPGEAHKPGIAVHSQGVLPPQPSRRAFRRDGSRQGIVGNLHSGPANAGLGHGRRRVATRRRQHHAAQGQHFKCPLHRSSPQGFGARVPRPPDPHKGR